MLLCRLKLGIMILCTTIDNKEHRHPTLSVVWPAPYTAESYYQTQSWTTVSSLLGPIIDHEHRIGCVLIAVCRFFAAFLSIKRWR